MTMSRSITFSRATASAICKSSSLLAETAMDYSFSMRPGARAAFAARGLRFIRGFLGIGVFALGSGGGAAPERLAHELVREHQPRFADVGEREPHERVLAFLHVGQLDQALPILRTADDAAEALAAVHRDGHLDFRLVPGPAREIAGAHERPVDPRGRDLEVIRAPD